MRDNANYAYIMNIINSPQSETNEIVKKGNKCTRRYGIRLPWQLALINFQFQLPQCPLPFIDFHSWDFSFLFFSRLINSDDDEHEHDDTPQRWKQMDSDVINFFSSKLTFNSNRKVISLIQSNWVWTYSTFNFF